MNVLIVDFRLKELILEDQENETFGNSHNSPGLFANSWPGAAPDSNFATEHHPAHGS
jgi:hypothetical protein